MRWRVDFLADDGSVTTRNFWTWRGAERWARRMSSRNTSYGINFYEKPSKP